MAVVLTGNGDPNYNMKNKVLFIKMIYYQFTTLSFETSRLHSYTGLGMSLAGLGMSLAGNDKYFNIIMYTFHSYTSGSGTSLRTYS